MQAKTIPTGHLQSKQNAQTLPTNCCFGKEKFFIHFCQLIILNQCTLTRTKFEDIIAAKSTICGILGLLQFDTKITSESRVNSL